MKLKVTNYIELIDAIYEANFDPTHIYEIELGGSSEAYVLRQPTAQLFGAIGFPVITGQIVIQGDGITLSRANDAPPFRLLLVDAKHTGRNGSLTLKNVNLRGGYSTVDGGGAMLNDGTVTLQNCTLQGNIGTKGGAIYNGDGRSMTIEGCTFSENVGLLRGAAIYNSSYARLTLTDTVFKENRVEYGVAVDVYVVSQFMSPITLSGSTPRVSINDMALTADQLELVAGLKPFGDTFELVEDEADLED